MNHIELHNMAAGFYFFSFFIFATIYGIVILTTQAISNKRAIMSLSTSIMHATFYFVPLLYKLPSGKSVGVTITFLEWMTFLSQLIFLIEILPHSKKTKSHGIRRIEDFNKLKKNIYSLSRIAPLIHSKE
ncbi:MAG: hypothetical protein JW891_14435 [Candidatus Lokiarchaeota archaeon]|nr:hypothetical protein [Candidatus Lokiarchaeota archaeon]